MQVGTRVRNNKENCTDQRAKNTPNDKHRVHRERRLGLCIVKNLDPRGSKGKVLYIKRNGSKMGRHRDCKEGG